MLNAISKIIAALDVHSIEEVRIILAHVDSVIEAVHGNYYLCPETEATGMKACAKDIQPAQGRSAFKRIVKQNSKSLKQVHSSATGQLFVDVSKNHVPAKRLKKGMPLRGSHKPHGSPIKPNGYNRPC